MSVPKYAPRFQWRSGKIFFFFLRMSHNQMFIISSQKSNAPSLRTHIVRKERTRKKWDASSPQEELLGAILRYRIEQFEYIHIYEYIYCIHINICIDMYIDTLCSQCVNIYVYICIHLYTLCDSKSRTVCEWESYDGVWIRLINGD